MKSNPLKNLIRYKTRVPHCGIYSACSANPLVIKAVMTKGLTDGSPVLIEATANQCNQFGGYTGMTPSAFVAMVHKTAQNIGFDERRLFIGGDHLGPLTFVRYNETKAMELSAQLISSYVEAGFTKIHIDTSMKVADDPGDKPLSEKAIAARTVYLAQAAEQAYTRRLAKMPGAVHPVYIIGSEVPTPGGATRGPSRLTPTSGTSFIKTEAAFHKAFIDSGLKKAWNNVIGFVVQPGIEESGIGCIDYDHNKARGLISVLNSYPNLVFEAHSTDYQTKENLRQLVNDGFAILKVGPALTFSLREGLFALSYIEDLTIKENRSDFRRILDEKMLQDPSHWQTHYHGNPDQLILERAFSFSDRCRYYLCIKEVTDSIETLLTNLAGGVDLSLLSQFLPRQYDRVRQFKLRNEPESILLDKIGDTIDDYLYASQQKDLLKEAHYVR